MRMNRYDLTDICLAIMGICLTALAVGLTLMILALPFISKANKAQQPCTIADKISPQEWGE